LFSFYYLTDDLAAERQASNFCVQLCSTPPSPEMTLATGLIRSVRNTNTN